MDHRVAGKSRRKRAPEPPPRAPVADDVLEEYAPEVVYVEVQRAQQVDVPLLTGVLAVVLSVIGVICTMQSVSVAQGMTVIWVGTALAVGAVVIAVSIPGMRTVVEAVTIIIAVICVWNAVSVNNQLDQKRQEIQQIIGTP